MSAAIDIRAIAADIAGDLRTAMRLGFLPIDWGIVEHCENDDDWIQVHQAFVRAIGGGSFLDWQEKPGRTREELIALCDRVARSEML